MGVSANDITNTTTVIKRQQDHAIDQHHAPGSQAAPQPERPGLCPAVLFVHGRVGRKAACICEAMVVRNALPRPSPSTRIMASRTAMQASQRRPGWPGYRHPATARARRHGLQPRQAVVQQPPEVEAEPACSSSWRYGSALQRQVRRQCRGDHRRKHVVHHRLDRKRPEQQPQINQHRQHPSSHTRRPTTRKPVVRISISPNSDLHAGPSQATVGRNLTPNLR